MPSFSAAARSTRSVPTGAFTSTWNRVQVKASVTRVPVGSGAAVNPSWGSSEVHRESSGSGADWTAMSA